MNIDLLVTDEHEMGLVADAATKHPPAGIMFDAETGILSIEYADLESVEMNIPVSEDYIGYLLYSKALFFGTIVNGRVEDGRLVPLMLLNDPMGAGDSLGPAPKLQQPVMAFERFMRRTESGQPIHRDDLADDENDGSVMGGMNPAVLQLAPHLARQRSLEIAPQAKPSAPGMGLGGGGGGGHRQAQQDYYNQQRGGDDDNSGRDE